MTTIPHEAAPRQARVPFPLHPLPPWTKDMGDYSLRIPLHPGRDGTITITRLLERGRPLDPPHVYPFDERGCVCQGAASGRVKYCRHEAMVHTVQVYFRCYRCARVQPIEEQFVWRSNEKGSYLACTACEERLRQEGFSGLQVASYAPAWFGRYFQGHEAKFLSKFMAALRGDRVDPFVQPSMFAEEG